MKSQKECKSTQQ